MLQKCFGSLFYHCDKAVFICVHTSWRGTCKMGEDMFLPWKATKDWESSGECG